MRLARVLEHQGLGGEPLFADLAGVRVRRQARLLHVYLKPYAGGESPAALAAFEVLFEVSLSNVLEQSPLAGVALAAVLTNVLPLFDVDALDVFGEVVFSGECFVAKLALL